MVQCTLNIGRKNFPVSFSGVQIGVHAHLYVYKTIKKKEKRDGEREKEKKKRYLNVLNKRKGSATNHSSLLHRVAIHSHILPRLPSLGMMEDIYGFAATYIG